MKKGTSVLQKYDYGYGQIDGSGNLDTTKNNGQLGRIESYIGTAKQWTQKFSYDSIGRLAESKEYRGDTNALTYKQTFDFDRFGNLYRKATSNNPTGQENPLPFTSIEETDISKATNRFTTETAYDDAGNVVTDDKFRSMGFSYDANGRMVKATKTSVPDSNSVYDAAGLRVAERFNDIWRFLVYDIGGKIVAEYGGPQQTDDGGMKYVLSDWQGSTRAIVGNTGHVQSRMDYSAFGESIGTGTGVRTAQQGFSVSDSLRQRYGLTERDEASGLDHTWFRKHENQAGRWTGADPYNGSINLVDPQSFNRYSYVENQPTNFIDPSGLNMSECGLRTLVITSCVDGVGCTIDDIQVIYVCSAGGGGTRDPGDVGGIGIGGSGPKVLQTTLEQDCEKYVRDALKRFWEYVAEWAKYDMEEDMKGGHPIMKNGKFYGYTSPYGHRNKMEEKQNGMRNNIKKYDKRCGNSAHEMPEGVREAADELIPYIRQPFSAWDYIPNPGPFPTEKEWKKQLPWGKGFPIPVLPPMPVPVFP